MARSAKLALLALATAFAVVHIAAVFTESINWDEFVLFHRAEYAIKSGFLDGGGRPGLGVLAVIPFVRGCASTIATVHVVRLVWVGLTVALLGGLFVFLRAATRRWDAAALGCGLYALVPVFLRWSLQVRTDQAALACAIWAGVALLASRRRPLLAIAAGALLGLAYLFSQKAIYAGALIGVVALGEPLQLRRDAIRAAGFAAGAMAVVVAYQVIVPRLYSAPVASLERGLDTFAWYRRIIGYHVYEDMLPTVIPHLALLAAVVAAAVRAGRTGSAQARPLLVALGVILLGVAIGAFHAAAFPYFWMTLGLFPAVAIATGWAGISELVPRAHWLAVAAWLCLVVRAVPYAIETLADTQKIQRDTFAFIDRALPADARGFQVEGGLFCRADPDPLPVFVGESMQRFDGASGEHLAASLIDQFRARPVSFLVRSHRLASFPASLQRFWHDNYVPYAAAVEVAGTRINGTPGSSLYPAIFVPGDYRYWGPGTVVIDRQPLTRGATVKLGIGVHTMTLGEAIRDGALVLALPDPPDPSTTPFHDGLAQIEIMGERASWW